MKRGPEAAVRGGDRAGPQRPAGLPPAGVSVRLRRTVLCVRVARWCRRPRMASASALTRAGGGGGGPGQLPEQRLPSRPQVAAPAEPRRAALLRRGRLWQVQRRRAGRGREPRGEVRGRVGVRGQCPRPPSTAGPSPPRSRGAARPVPPESLSDSRLPLQMRRAQEPRARGRAGEDEADAGRAPRASRVCRQAPALPVTLVPEATGPGRS